MPRDTPYGPCLTAAEYERRVIDLQRDAPRMPTREQDRAMRHRALDLAIDHRLGRDFPEGRRQAMWEAAERVDSRRLRLGLEFLVRGFFSKANAGHADALTKALAKEFGRVLDRADLERFLGLEAGAEPALPLDDSDQRR